VSVYDKVLTALSGYEISEARLWGNASEWIVVDGAARRRIVAHHEPGAGIQWSAAGAFPQRDTVRAALVDARAHCATSGHQRRWVASADEYRALLDGLAAVPGLVADAIVSEGGGLTASGRVCLRQIEIHYDQSGYHGDEAAYPTARDAIVEMLSSDLDAARREVEDLARILAALGADGGAS